MSKWKATMPREKPDDGTAFVVVSIKRSDGGRVEFSGQVTDERAASIWTQVPLYTEDAND